MTLAEAIRAKNATLCAGCGVVKLTGKSAVLELPRSAQPNAAHPHPVRTPQDAAFATAYDDAIQSARGQRRPAVVEIILRSRDTIR